MSTASVTSFDQHVSAKSSVAVVRQLAVDDLGSSMKLGAASGAADRVRRLHGCGDDTVDLKPLNQWSKLPESASVSTDQSQVSVDVSPCSDVTESLEVDSALGVAPMKPLMTSHTYMTSSGNPIMTSRLLSVSQRPFIGTWHGLVTNGYVSDGDVCGASATLHQNGYVSEGGVCRSHNLPGLNRMPLYLDNVDDDDDDR